MVGGDHSRNGTQGTFRKLWICPCQDWIFYGCISSVCIWFDFCGYPVCMSVDGFDLMTVMARVGFQGVIGVPLSSFVMGLVCR